MLQVWVQMSLVARTSSYWKQTNKQTNVALLNDESEQTERKIWEKICHIYTTIAFLCFILGLRLTPQSVGRNWWLLVVYAAVGVEFLQWTENWALALWSGHMEAWRCMSSSAAPHPVARRQDWFWTRSAGCQAWQQSPQPTEPCCWHLRSSYSFLLAQREDSLSTGVVCPRAFLGGNDQSSEINTL